MPAFQQVRKRGPLDNLLAARRAGQAGGFMDDEIVTVEIPIAGGQAVTAVGHRSFLDGDGPTGLPARAAAARQLLYDCARGQAERSLDVSGGSPRLGQASRRPPGPASR
jgi:hypothetical protein